MKIEAGKYYRTRDGDVVGPMARYAGRDDTFTAMGHTWNKDGSFVRGNTSKLDLISEVYVSDTPPDAPLPDIITDQPCKTLRDEFASDWMKAVLANPNHADGDMESFACMAYRMADAMMEARKK
jgi:hypothetical protein